LLGSLQTIQEIFHSWYPDLAIVPVEADAAEVLAQPRDGLAGSFFSGGVDSLFTLLKHRSKISRLIWVYGFDVGLGDTSLREQVFTALNAFSSQFGAPLLEVETNLREFTDQYSVPWGTQAHGAALASVGQLLGGVCSRIFIPSSDSYAQLAPWGSHPLLDPLWSTESVLFVHDGCEADRAEKTAAIAEDDLALSVLRVCWENRNGAHNCGECEKCLHTMITMELIGAFKRCRTFDHPLRLDAIRDFPICGPGSLPFWNNKYRAALLQGREDIAKAIEAAVNKYRSTEAAELLLEHFDGVVESPIWKDLLRTRREPIFKSFWQFDKHWLTRSVVVEGLKSLLASGVSSIKRRSKPYF
jgi:hypothetical protein